MNKRKRSFKDSIRRTLIVYALLPVIFITFLFLGAVYIFLNLTTIRQTVDSNTLISNHLVQVISGYEKLAADISQHSDISIIKSDTTKRTALYERLYSYTNNASERAEFFLFDSSLNSIVASSNSLPVFAKRSTGISWGPVRQMRERPDKVIFSLNSVYINNVKQVRLDISKAIVKDSKIVGYIVFSFTDDSLFRSIRSVPAQIVVSNRFDSIFLATSYSFSDNIDKTVPQLRMADGYTKYNNQKYFISKSTILDGEFNVYSIMPITKLTSDFLYTFGVLVLVFGMLTVTIFISSKKISKSKTRIIDELVEGFECVKRGNLDKRMYISTGDEFEIIGDAYNIMLDSFKKLIEISNEKARQTILSEIKQLESQFNPHFLFNTLENIKFMSKMDPDTANKMIVSLSTLLRYSINSDIKASTLAEDIEYTENYLLIQKYRFGSRFNFIISTQPETEDCIIPKLIIQPIIENAVKYGFDEKDCLTVRIKSSIMGETLVLAIFDDGDGMEAEQLLAINNILNSKTNESNHIGLFNVHRRIQLMYGGDYGIDINSQKGEGTVVRITLPIYRRGDDKNDQNSDS